MADNVAVTEGSGKTIATDDVGGAQYQRVKLDGGSDGAGTPVLAGGGVEASALRVTVASDSTGVLSVDDNGSSLTVDGTLTGITNTVAVYFDRGDPGVKLTSGTLTDITNSIKVHLLSTGGTIGVRVGQIDGTTSIYLAQTAGTIGVRVGLIEGTTAIYLHSTGGTIGVNVGKISDTIAIWHTGTSGTQVVSLDRDKATLSGIASSISVHLLSTAGTIRVGDIPGSIAVYFSPANPAVAATFSGSLAVVPVTGSGDAIYDEVNNAMKVVNITNGTLAVNVGKIDDNVSVKFASVAGTAGVNLGKQDGTLTVKIDPAGIALVNAAHTANIFTVSASTSGVSASGVTVVSPSANASFKVFAFSISTTGIVHMVPKFTNGAGTSPTEYWRVALQGPSGANLAVTPPGFLFQTGVSTTLAIVNDTASLIHYSVSYIKESA